MNNQNYQIYNSQQQYSNNPILAAINRNSTPQNNQQNFESNNFRNMLNAYRNARNPQQMLMNMVQQNPQMKTIMNMVNNNGGNAQNLFYALARQRGIDPDAFIKNIFG